MINITTFINPTSFRELGILQYWMNNNKEIWNSIFIKFGLKFGIDFPAVGSHMDLIFGFG
jgi:hypothetical protein